MNDAARHSLVGAGIGAGLMFLLDPARGKRRRALIRDKMAYAARKTRDAAGATRRDVGNRLQGMTQGLRARFSSAPPTSGSSASASVPSSVASHHIHALRVSRNSSRRTLRFLR